MALVDLTDWLNEFSRPGCVWYAKRLSGNDTLANNSHQAGPYIPKDLLFSVFPSINNPDLKNPDKWFDLFIDSHADHRQVRAIWYNNKFHGSTAKSPRNEARVTNFGGQSSALLDPESTGALALFIFDLESGTEAKDCHVWVCQHATEEELIEDRIGPVEPGQFRVWTVDELQDSLFKPELSQRSSCWLNADEIPPEWLLRFPTGLEIIEKALELRPVPGLTPDERLLRRRACEFEVFGSLEEAVELPIIRQGFHDLEDFLARAQTILQRRKSRSGRSLELHARQVFLEENLSEGRDFSHQPESDPGQKPDFLFPSEAAYKNAAFPTDRLRMLAVKTTCKDRWRQITREANRIPLKHLLTIQEGVSENQFREMTESGVKLVVPSGLVTSFPESVRPHLQSLESFIGDVRLLSLGL